jgi:hypothetical protein
MKKINKTLALTLGAGAMLTVQSCSEDFLDVDHYDILSPEYIQVSEQGMDDGVRACYANMNQLTNGDSMKPWLWLAGHPTMDTQATGWDKSWLTQDWAADQGELYDEWKRLFDGITLCNNMIQNCDEAETKGIISKEQITEARAEARAMRGFYYYLAAQTWANVPIMKVGQQYTDELPGNGGAEGNAVEVLDEIISDLTYAAANLPQDWKPYNGQYGRATKGMATAFLAEAYLWKAYRKGNASGQGEEVTKAKELLKSIIDSGEYELLPSFTTLFDPFAWNKECLWEEVMDEGDQSGTWGPFHTNAHGWTDNYAATPGDNGGWGTLYLSWEWYTCYEKGDKRRDASACTSTIDNWGDYTDRITGEPLSTAAKSDYCYGQNPYQDEIKNGQPRYHCNTGGDRAPSVWSMKWWRTGKNTWWSNIWNPVHIYWKRYADVLLTYAECCFRTGAIDEGWQYVDQVRQRAWGQLEDGKEAELTTKYGQYYYNFAVAAYTSTWTGTFDKSHFEDVDGNLKYPLPFGSNGNVAPAGKTYYETVKSKLGFNLETWQVAMIQERRKEFNSEWTLAPALHRAGLLAEHIRCNYPKDLTKVADLDEYPWTPRTYEYSEDKMDFPIPATEILRNPNLTQNKAYR